MKKTILLFALFSLFFPCLMQAASNIDTPPAVSPLNIKQELNNQLAATITAAEFYQQRLQTRLAQLQEQNKNLTMQLSSLKQQLQQVTNALTLAQSTHPQSPDVASAPNFWQRITAFNLNNPLIDFRVAVGFILVGLFLLAWLLWFRSPASVSSNTDLAEDEYDFMGSEEAIPAKIDLARAYIEMGKELEAKEVLDEVLQKGNTSQRNEAKEILTHLSV